MDLDPANQPINLDALATATKAVLDERFDGYVLIGFVAGTHMPMEITCTRNCSLVRMALQQFLREVALDLGECGEDDD